MYNYPPFFTALFKNIGVVFKKSLDSKGRSGILEYWFFTVFNIFVLTISISIKLYSFNESSRLFFFIIIYSLIIVLPSISVTLRRFHDIGLGAVYLLVLLIPFVQWYAVYLLTKKSIPNDNQYGAKPEFLE